MQNLLHAGAFVPPPDPGIKFRLARRIVTASGKRARGGVCSVKYRKWLYWESRLEQVALHRLEFSQHVTEVWSQPYCITIPNGQFEYTPDILVSLHSGELVFIECKPRSVLNTNEVSERMAAINTFFIGFGARFVICDDTELKPGVIFRNAMDLMRHRRPPIKPHELVPYHASIKAAAPTTCGDLFEAVPSHIALHALAAGWLHFNFNQPLDRSTAVFQQWQGEYDAASFIQPR